MTPYLDIHTHRREFIPDSVSVLSLSIKELQGITPEGEYLCGGIHPWWLEELSSEEIEDLKYKILGLVKNGSLWGIGETGLDRLYPEFLDQQKELLRWHIDLSEEYGLPLILHNVRAGSDYLEILKALRPTVPWIFHDYRGNEVLMKDILKLHGKSFFSFGISIDNSQTIRELLPNIPMENLLLETDDQRHLDIHDIYLRASHHIGVELDFLKSQIWHNFKKLHKTN